VFETAGMQGSSVLDRELLDAAALCGHLVPAGSVYALLAEHRERLFPPEVFSDLFPSGRGRPSVPGEVIASAMVLKELEGLSDRQAATALATDIRWKVACGLALDEASFDPSVLVYWRRRLNASQRPHRIDEAVKDVAVKTGVLNGRSRRALDSTVLDDAVATQDTVTQLVAAVRKVRKLVPAAREVHVSAHDYDRGGKPDIAWDDEVARDALVTALATGLPGVPQRAHCSGKRERTVIRRFPLSSGTSTAKARASSAGLTPWRGATRSRVAGALT